MQTAVGQAEQHRLGHWWAQQEAEAVDLQAPPGQPAPVGQTGPAAEAAAMRPEALDMELKAETAEPTAAEAEEPEINLAETAESMAAAEAAVGRAPLRRLGGPTVAAAAKAAEMDRLALRLLIQFFFFISH